MKYLLSLITLSGMGIALAIFLPLKSAPMVGVKGNFSLSEVSVVDTVGGDILTGMTVLIEQGRISQIIPSSQYQPHPDFVDIPARGKYLLPGLWDMHTHSLKLSPQLHHPLFLRHGITSVRDMSGCLIGDDSYWACPEDRTVWEQQAISGKRISPRYPLQSSYQTNGGSEVPKAYPDFFRLSDREDARKLVNFYVEQEVDFIKTYTELSPEQFDNLVEVAARNEIALAGHKPLTIPLTRALQAGMKSIEHGRLFMFECFDGIDAFRKLDNPIAYYNAQFMRQMLQDQNKEKCITLMRAMASSDTYWVPTLTTLKMSAMANDLSFRRNPALETIPYIVRKLLWEPDINRASQQGYDQEGGFVHADFYAAASAQVGTAHRLGVKLLAGTDNIDTYVFSGASLHDELKMLVDAGLTPHQAIQTATINAARFSGLDHEFGSVDIGKHADLLLLNENPLLDISNTKNIFAVFIAGQHFDQQALGTLDRYAVEMGQSLQVNVQFLFNLFASPLMRVQLAD
jgi:imidazolonepropionase-like amidohydrolase